MVNARNKHGVLQGQTDETRFDLTRVVATDLVQGGYSNGLNPATWWPVYWRPSEVSP